MTEVLYDMDQTTDEIVGEPIAASNWLDRLRSSKGFTHPSNGLDLNHFLPNSDHHHSQTALHSANPNGNRPPYRSSCVRGKTSHWSDIRCILSDLFNIGGYHHESQFTAKAARKQSNPRFIRPGLPEDDDYSSRQPLRKEEASLASFSSLFSAGSDADDGEEGHVNSGEDNGLGGYSKSEVTVIDTSCEGWKFEKVLLRRKGAWKVKDLKGRSNSILKKNKKKMTQNGSTEEKRRKKKRKRLEEDDC